MKAIIGTFTLVAVLCLAGCHAGRDKAESTGPAASSSATASSTDKAIEKSRDAMMGKSMDVQSEHWASTPAAASTAAAATPSAAPASSPSPAAEPTVPKGGKR